MLKLKTQQVRWNFEELHHVYCPNIPLIGPSGHLKCKCFYVTQLCGVKYKKVGIFSGSSEPPEWPRPVLICHDSLLYLSQERM